MTLQQGNRVLSRTSQKVEVILKLMISLLANKTNLIIALVTGLFRLSVVWYCVRCTVYTVHSAL